MTETPVMSIWTIYERPIDFPDEFVAREFHIAGGRYIATRNILTDQLLGALRAKLADLGLVRLHRNPEDEPQIVESWL